MRRLSLRNNSTENVSSEIDEIIARAMAEYANAKGIEVFTDSNTQPTSTPEPAIVEAQEPAHEEIPKNSESILVSETTSRFSSAIWFDNIQTKAITLAGLGGIGSYVAFMLARMNPARLALYDDDVVESANMSGQLYANRHIGEYKVFSLNNILQDFANYFNTFCFGERYTQESEASEIMICGFDNMDARNLYYHKWKAFVDCLPSEQKKKCLFIDGRLAAENFQVLCITGDNDYYKAQYEQDFLFSDYQADETICSYKQTTFMANMIGSIIVNLFVNFCANECDPLVPRDLPFYTEYNAETMFFKVKA